MKIALFVLVATAAVVLSDPSAYHEELKRSIMEPEEHSLVKRSAAADPEPIFGLLFGSRRRYGRRNRGGYKRYGGYRRRYNKYGGYGGGYKRRGGYRGYRRRGGYNKYGGGYGKYHG